MHKGLDSSVRQLLQQGTVIPAHPLALRQDLTIDERRQRALTRYYLDSGAGGLAVGVHTTQFAIRKPEINLLEPVLQMAAEEIAMARLTRPVIKVAGICGPGQQALREAGLAAKYGYDLGLLSMGGLGHYPEGELIEHARAVAEIIPVFGFYLQPAVGGRLLSYSFWRAFSEIPNVHAIKVAAFNRYQTLDVVRAVCDSSRRNEIALYTGNDDNIVADLLTPYRFKAGGQAVEKRFVGGLLGHWAVWTRGAVALFDDIKRCIAGDYEGVEGLLARGMEVTDINAVIFDAKNSFKGCIPGIHELLRRQGLLEGTYCLDPEEKLSAGQMEEIDRIVAAYPSYKDEAVVLKAT
jgi:dihydrodipicolinate synthase/N-acetylneuraminate lyase